MCYPLRLILLLICVVAIVLLASMPPWGADVEAQEVQVRAPWLDLVNDVRLDRGLNPYGLSRLLSDAAQRHADDLAANGFAEPDDVHLGSDGTDEETRITEAGYSAWLQDDATRVVGEDVWVGRGTPEDALTDLLGEATRRENLLSDVYREMGVGRVIDADGDSYYVLVFAARPNVLPIFINDGAPSTKNPEIAIRLTNERVRPEGKGTNFMGEAIEIRISDKPAFEGLPWQSWAPLISWIVPETVGQHTVYVQFRDAAGRTAASADNIYFGEETPIAPSALPSSGTPQATDTPTSSSPAPAPILSTPDATASTPVSGSVTVPSTSQSSSITPFPTWTPLPSPKPARATVVREGGVALSLPESGEYGKPLAAAGVLQGVAVVLGVYLLIVRNTSKRDE